MHSRRSILLVSLVVMMLGIVTVFVHAQDDDMTEISPTIEFEVEGLYPEGIAFDAAGDRFLVSSLTQGVITVVDYDGNTEVLIDDDDLVSAIGIHIDEERGRLLVANSDPGASVKTSADTQGVLAELGIYDLATGERLHLVDLDDLAPEMGHFANDIAIDADGNAYVTDSFSPIIYVVDVDGNAEILLQDDRFAAEGFGLNGIVLHPDGYLVVAKMDEGALFKIPVDDPSAFTQVELEDALGGADGLVLLESGELVVIVNVLNGDSANQIVLLESDDEWASASVVATQDAGDLAPTTGTVRGSDVHVLFGYLNVLFNPETETPQTTFAITRADELGMSE